MKYLLLVFLLTVQAAHAITIVSEEYNNINVSWVGGFSILKVNNQKVKLAPSKSCTLNNCVYKGKMSDELLQLGWNVINFDALQVGCKKNDYVLATYNSYALTNEGNQISLFTDLRREGKCPAQLNQSTTVNVSLKQLNSKLYNEIEQLINEQDNRLHQFLDQFESSERDLQNEKARLDALEKSIKECYATATSSANLSNYETQLAQCDNYKKAYNQLDNLIKSKELVSEEQKQYFNDNLQKFGTTLSEFKYQGKSVISPERVDEIEKTILAQIPKVKEQKDQKVNFYSQFAQTIIAQLEKLYADGKRDEFIELAQFAEQNLNDYSAELVAQNYPYAETLALNEATKSIDKTLEKYVDQNFWFKDSNIPEETKKTIDEVLKKINPKVAKDLKVALQMKDKVKNEIVRNGINNSITFFGILNAIKDNTTNEAIDGFVSKAAGQFVSFIKNDGMCLGARFALNDAADLFELVSGRDFCDVKRELTWQERVFAGLGLVVGSGELWAKVSSKASGEIKDISSSISAFFKKGTQAGLKNEKEVIDYAKVISSSQDQRLMKSALDKSIDEVRPIHFFNPINEGPLSKIKFSDGSTVADTFRSSSYFRLPLDEDIILYRVRSIPTNSNEVLGPYWSRLYPNGSLSSKLDLALLDSYKNKANELVRIKIPKGTPGIELFEGIAGEQRTVTGKLIGGGNQVFIKMDDLEQLKLKIFSYETIQFPW